MEHKYISCGSLVPRSDPWFIAVAKNAEDEDDHTQVHIFYNLHDPMSYYRFQIPELLGKRIRGCFHGSWALLSSNHPHDVMWSLWNPMTSKMIYLPPLIHKGDYDDIKYFCLSAPPDKPNSVLLLTRTGKLNIVFCRIGSNSNACNRKKLRWTEMSYAKQVKSIAGFEVPLLNLTCCNGKVYANIRVANNITPPVVLLVEVNIMVDDCKRKKLREVEITFLRISDFPWPTSVDCCMTRILLNGSCTQLFTIVIGFKDETCKTVAGVNLFKLDMNSRTWEEMKDLKDTTLFLDLDSVVPVFYRPAISSSELGGYIHFLGDYGKIVYSYHVKDKTISLSSMSFLEGTRRMSAWAMLECIRLEGDRAHFKQKVKGDEIVVRSVKGDHEVEFDCMKDETHLLNFPFRFLKMNTELCVGVQCLKLFPFSCFGYECRLKSDDADSKQDEDKHDDDIRALGGNEDESHLLNIPLHVLESVMEYSVGVEYLKFRSTCKQCHFAAPLIKCNNGKALKRLQTYSPLSPCWLMVFDRHEGIITFTDPMSGDKYFIKTPQELICDFQILCSRYGWLLIERHDGSVVFFNPFTSDIRQLPLLRWAFIYCFSAPPTSPDCMVVGLTEGYVIIHFVAQEPPTWRCIDLNYNGHDSYSYRFATFFGQDLYAIRDDGGLDVFEKFDGKENHSWRYDVVKAPTSCCTSFPQYFYVRCDQHLLQVIVDKFGESVEVLKLSDSTHEWVKVDGLGKHMIYICGTSSSICIDAKTPHMENKIFFPRLRSNNGEKMIFYSLETCRYHTFNNKNIGFEDFFGTKLHLVPHAWIEPRWA